METLTFLSFTNSKPGRKPAIPEGKVAVGRAERQNKFGLSPYSQLTFNVQTCNLITQCDFKFMQVAENNYTGELYLVLSKNEQPDSMLLSRRGKKSSYSVTNKHFITFLIEKFRLSVVDGYMRDYLSVSDNISTNPDKVVLKLTR